MTTNNLRIGATAGTVSDMPHPNSNPIPTNRNNYNEVVETQSGERIMNYTRKQKIDYSLQFDKKTKADYDTLKAFCNVPVAYYVIIQNNTGTTQIADGYYYLILAQENHNVKTDIFRYNFVIEFIAE